MKTAGSCGRLRSGSNGRTRHCGRSCEPASGQGSGEAVSGTERPQPARGHAEGCCKIYAGGCCQAARNDATTLSREWAARQPGPSPEWLVRGAGDATRPGGSPRCAARVESMSRYAARGAWLPARRARQCGNALAGSLSERMPGAPASSPEADKASWVPFSDFDQRDAPSLRASQARCFLFSPSPCAV